MYLWHPRLGFFAKVGVSRRSAFWFMWEQQFRGSDASRWDLMSREALTGDYDHSRAAPFAEPRFDMDWWTGTALLTS